MRSFFFAKFQPLCYNILYYPTRRTRWLNLSFWIWTTRCSIFTKQKKRRFQNHLCTSAYHRRKIFLTATVGTPRKGRAYKRTSQNRALQNSFFGARRWYLACGVYALLWRTARHRALVRRRCRGAAQNALRQILSVYILKRRPKSTEQPSWQRRNKEILWRHIHLRANRM